MPVGEAARDAQDAANAAKAAALPPEEKKAEKSPEDRRKELVDSNQEGGFQKLKPDVLNDLKSAAFIGIDSKVIDGLEVRWDMRSQQYTLTYDKDAAGAAANVDIEQRARAFFGGDGVRVALSQKTNAPAIVVNNSSTF